MRTGRILAAISVLALLLGGLSAAADSDDFSSEPDIDENAAAEYTDEISFTTLDRNEEARVTDGNMYSWQTIFESAEVTAEHPFTQLYLIWHDRPGEYTVSYDGGELACGENGFLHELVTFPEPVSSIEINCDDGWLCELRVFSEGTLPHDVQVWEPADGKADVLVFPTHADDDCLFFGAFIADAIDRGLSVQLAFLTVHAQGRHPGAFWDREHERLNGMWEMGLTRYPASGGFPDYGADYVLTVASMFGVGKIEAWQVETIRRFRPEIILCHDLNGEYGNNAHKVNARALTAAIFSAADCTEYPGSFEEYGAWQAKKMYVHLSAGREIELEVNAPLDAFGGRTAFEVAKDAYGWHESQHVWRNFQVRQDDKQYNCRRFGLAYSSVGPDTGNDYTENLY